MWHPVNGTVVEMTQFRNETSHPEESLERTLAAQLCLIDCFALQCRCGLDSPPGFNLREEWECKCWFNCLAIDTLC